MSNYIGINHKVMTDTKSQYETLPLLKSAVQSSIKRQYMVKHEDKISNPMSTQSRTHYVVSPKRSFEAASGYLGKRIAVLNFANNHSVGGAPFSSGAQEESLCRCSTLYPCLQAMWEPFYVRHQNLYNKGIINHVGNDDLIYTPDVVVFKTDERTDPIYPMMMPEEKWFKVDIITCAAPELWHGNKMPDNYDKIIESRIRKILDVAEKEHVEVLILGAWGCGAFKNPPKTIAQTFHNLLAEYSFETVEFALASDGDSVFHKVFETELDRVVPTPAASSTDARQLLEQADNSVKGTIISLLRATGRENIESMIDWMEKNSFFEAAASKNMHNAFKGGLAKHSLDVYYEAMALNKSKGLPQSSVTLCALLHDVCKADQFYVDASGSPQCNEYKKRKGHGLRSVFIVTQTGKLPLNYDEAMAIWWHMGEYEESFKHHPGKYDEYFEKSKKIDLCNLIRLADWTAADKANPKAAPVVEPRHLRNSMAYKRDLKVEVSYNPRNGHWYLDTHNPPMEHYPTRYGSVDSSSLTRRMMATEYCVISTGICHNIHFLKDDMNRIGIFTLVETLFDLGSLYRTDRKGFGYKSAILYLDTCTSTNLGGHQYLVTEDMSGMWSLLRIYSPERRLGQDYYEAITRDKIAKGFKSEKDVLDYFKNMKNGQDLTDTNRFERLDSEGPY